MAGVDSEKEATVIITRIAKQLNSYKTSPNKDTLVKFLKEAAGAFPKINQSASRKLNIKPLGDSLVKHGVLQHKDKDIRILVADCFCEILRVLAPDPGFGDAVSRDIFTIFISIFAELDDTASPYFSKRVKILETIAKLKCCVIMLDIGCDNLVLKLFKTLFSVARLEHSHCVVSAMSSLMIHILEEKLDEKLLGQLISEEKFSEPLLDVILQNLLKEVQGASPGSFQLAVSVIQNCNPKIEHFICAFLRSCIINDIIGSKVRESFHEVIVEILQFAPHMLLTVIPSLTNELMVDQIDVRMKALHLTKKLFAMPGHQIAQQYRAFFSEFLNRFVDKSSEVRLYVISCAKFFYMNNPSGAEALEVLSALENRLLDFDDRIRTEAVTVVCELAGSNLNTFPIELLHRVTERLWDKKVCVRKRTFEKLLELYREYCRKCTGGIMSISDDFEQIPCKILMLYYNKDCKEFRPLIMDVLADDLFPASLSIKERCRHWISAFSLFEPLHQKAFNSILSQKGRLRQEMQNYLELRNIKENVDSEELEKRTKAMFRNMALSFPDPVKAEESFHKLHLVKDNIIFCMLEELLYAETSADAHSTKDDLLKKIKDQNPHFEFLQLLFTKCSLNIFSSQHIGCLLDYLCSEELGNKQLEDSSLQLLLSIIDAFPSLLRGLEKRLLLLFSKDIIPFKEQFMHILAREGPHSSFQFSDIYSSLEKICLEGTRAQAKMAVSVVTAFSVSSEKFCSKLRKSLVDSLHARKSIPTVLQSLGCIAQHCISTTEAQEIICHILKEIFQVTDVGITNGQDVFTEISMWSGPYKWIVYALKALVRSFLPHRHTEANRRINYLLDIILQLLRKGGFSDRLVLSDDEKGEIRLAAAKSVLRLSRKWDLHISPLIFRLTVLMAKDDDPQVRRLFLDKLHRLVKVHSIPSRYACAFAVAASDSEEDIRENAFKGMKELLGVYGKAAQLHQSSGKNGILINQPVYMVVFLLHVVAHSTDFPPMECQSEETHVATFSPLVFTIYALVKTNFADCGIDICHNNASSLWMIFKAIKRAEDATDILVTPKLHAFADFGISVLNALQCKSTSMSKNHGLILLPSALYKMSLSEEQETSNTALQNNKFDESFTMDLIHGLGVQISQTSSANKHGKYFHEDSLAGPDKCTKSSLSLCKRVDTSESLIKKHCKNQSSYQEHHENVCQNVHARGPKTQAGSLSSGALIWQTESGINGEHEEAPSGGYGQIFSSDTATKRPALAQLEDLSSERKMLDASEGNSSKKQKEFCSRKVLQTVKPKRRNPKNNNVDASASGIIDGNKDEDAVGRRLRRRRQ